MYKQIKALADEAIVLQNKNRMDAVLREIAILCEQASSIEHGFVYIGPATGTPNPVVLDGPIGEIVAPCSEADAYLAATEAAKALDAKPSLQDLNATTVAAVGAVIKAAAKPAKKGAK